MFSFQYVRLVVHTFMKDILGTHMGQQKGYVIQRLCQAQLQERKVSNMCENGVENVGLFRVGDQVTDHLKYFFGTPLLYQMEGNQALDGQIMCEL